MGIIGDMNHSITVYYFCDVVRFLLLIDELRAELISVTRTDNEHSHFGSKNYKIEYNHSSYIDMSVLC